MSNQLIIPAQEIKSLSKKDIISLAETTISTFDSSLNDPIEILAVISKASLFLETLEKGIKAEALNELQKTYAGKHIMLGIEFQEAEVGVKYDFTENAKWVELNEQIEKLNEKRKDLEAFIKTLKSKTVTVDEETGEAVEWFPASKSSTTQIKKTIK